MTRVPGWIHRVIIQIGWCGWIFSRQQHNRGEITWRIQNRWEDKSLLEPRFIALFLGIAVQNGPFGRYSLFITTCTVHFSQVDGVKGKWKTGEYSTQDEISFILIMLLEKIVVISVIKNLMCCIFDSKKSSNVLFPLRFWELIKLSTVDKVLSEA